MKTSLEGANRELLSFHISITVFWKNCAQVAIMNGRNMMQQNKHISHSTICLSTTQIGHPDDPQNIPSL